MPHKSHPHIDKHHALTGTHVAAVDLLWHAGTGKLQPDSVPGKLPRGDPHQEGSQPCHMDAGGDWWGHLSAHQGCPAGLPYPVSGIVARMCIVTSNVQAALVGSRHSFGQMTVGILGLSMHKKLKPAEV